MLHGGNVQNTYNIRSQIVKGEQVLEGNPDPKEAGAVHPLHRSTMSPVMSFQGNIGKGVRGVPAGVKESDERRYVVYTVRVVRWGRNMCDENDKGGRNG